MIDSARLGAVVDECAAGASEFVVEGAGGCQAAEAGEDSFSEAGQGAGAVAFEGQEVFAGPEDAFDALADGRIFQVDDAQWDAFQAALDNPPADNPKLRRLLRRRPAWEK